MIRKIHWIFWITPLLFVGCNKAQKTASNGPQRFSLVASKQSNITFSNKVENQKDFNIFKYRNFYNGGGVAIGDINNDGLADIYFTANMGANKLYLNKGNWEFQDISESAGVHGNKPWSTGVVMVDINQDGLLDIYVSNAGNMEGENHNNDLYINNGDLTFSGQAKAYNLAETGFSTHASFFDYDKDGDLDAYILNNSNIPVSSLGFAHQREVRAQDWNVPKMFRGVISTETIAETLATWQSDGSKIAFVICGPDGLHPSLKAKASVRWSLGRITLPHPLVRVILAEQLYRAWSINAGHPYHRA